MADANDDAEKRDEEQEVSDTDADTRDEDAASKTDEEQVVRDTDSDTKAVDSRLDAIEDMLQRMNGTLQKVVSAQSVLVESGAIVDTDYTDPTEDDGMGAALDNGVLDLTIKD